MSSRERLLAIIACLLWSTAFVGVKAGLEFMPPLIFAGFRFILAAFMLFPFVGGAMAMKTAWCKHRRTVVLASLYNTVGLYALFFIAMQLTRGAQAAILIGASPLVYAVVAHFVMEDDRMSRRKMASIGFGVAGIVLLAVAGKPWEPVGARESFGLFLLLCATIIGAFGNVVVAKGNAPDLHPVALTSLQMGVGGVILLLAGLVIEDLPTQAVPLRFYGILGWLAFLSAAAFSLWFHLLQRVPISDLNMWKFLIPLFGSVLSWLLLKNEHPDILTVCGMILVAIGVVASQRPAENQT